MKLEMKSSAVRKAGPVDGEGRKNAERVEIISVEIKVSRDGRHGKFLGRAESSNDVKTALAGF